MNIFIFCESASSGKGGMEKTAINVANHFSIKNNVALGYFFNKEDRGLSYSVKSNVRLLARDVTNESLPDYFRRLSRENIEIAIYFSIGPESIKFVQYFKEFNVPLIIHEGSNPKRVIENNWVKQRGLSKWESMWEREKVYSCASAIRFTLPDYVESVPLFMKKNCYVFPNAFDIPEGKSSLVDKKIINIGGLKKNKNIEPLLQALSIVFDKHPNWKLEVYSTIGNNLSAMAYADSVADKVKDLGLNDNVFIKGEVDDIYSQYLSSSIHVITSLSEGLSNAVCESMCCGVPTVGIEGVPGVDGLVSHDVNGILVSNSNLVENLAKEISCLISDEDKRIRLGKQARDDAVIFKPDVIFKQWEKLVDLAIKNYSNKDFDEISAHYERSNNS